MWVYEMWEILMMDCEVYEWSNVDMVLVEGEGDINVRCEICHVVM